MSEPYVGEVRLVGFNFAPEGWFLCQGQLISIAEYSTLFQLIGTTYGGDGQSSFGLPNLQGRVPVHQGSLGSSRYVMGQPGGTESVTLGLAQYPSHTHLLQASSNGSNSANPGNNTLGAGLAAFSSDTPATPMGALMVGNSNGSNLAHDNMQPYTALNWVISWAGVYPPQS